MYYHHYYNDSFLFSSSRVHQMPWTDGFGPLHSSSEDLGTLEVFSHAKCELFPCSCVAFGINLYVTDFGSYKARQDQLQKRWAISWYCQIYWLCLFF